MVGIGRVAADVKLRWGDSLLVFAAVCLCRGRDGDLVFGRRAMEELVRFTLLVFFQDTYCQVSGPP